MESQLRQLLLHVQENEVSVEDALQQLRFLPFEDLGFAKLDHHRTLRRGFPEVIFCTGKTPEQVLQIAGRLHERSDVLATRVESETVARLQNAFPQLEYNEQARTVLIRRQTEAVGNPATGKPVLVCCAGTSDIPVAEEAAVTAGAMQQEVRRLYDVGVAGLQRILASRKKLEEAGVLIVVAGMDGALPAVISGLVDKPVIAVPTSVGYGANFAGLAPLLTMLNSCSPGVVVVNIDNGFGAGYFAAMINR